MDYGTARLQRAKPPIEIGFLEGCLQKRFVAIVLNKFALHQSYPNPFNPTTTIRYDLERATDIRLAIFDLLGREVVVLVDEHQPAGRHEIVWDGSTLPSGMYFYLLQAGDFVGVGWASLSK